MIKREVEQLLQQADAAQDAGDLTQTEEICRQIFQMDPSNVIAYRRLGGLLMRRNKADEAIALYRQAIEKNSDDPRPYIVLAEALIQQNEIDEGIVLYQQAVQLDPDNPDIHFLLKDAQRKKDSLKPRSPDAPFRLVSVQRADEPIDSTKKGR